MYSAIFNVTFDCNDARVVSAFWGAVTGYSLEQAGTPGNEYWVASPPAGGWPRMVFVAVPERKVVKNRVHIDVMPINGDQDEEVNRLLGLGATVVDDRREGSRRLGRLGGSGGNEFCME